MPAPLPLTADEADVLEQYCADLGRVGLRPWRSTRSAAATFIRRVRGGRWDRLDLTQQLALTKVEHAVPFVSWLIVTGRLRVDARFVTAAGLRLGHAASLYQPAAYQRFCQAAARLGTRSADVRLQWHALVLLAAAVGCPADQVDDEAFTSGRAVLLAAYRERGWPNAGRNPSAILHRLQTTLFHGGLLETLARPTRPLIRVTGWQAIAPAYAEVAHRYLAQVAVSLRPSTVTCIERDLRGFGRFLARQHPEIQTPRPLTRAHIEACKAHLLSAPSHTGRPLAKPTVRNTLINLRCFFTRITEWGYADAPARPLIFDADLPIIDRPLPRFLDDPTAAKLARAARAESDPFTRLVVELLARTGLRKGELLALTVDAVVQIGSAFWLRVPVGKLHTDRYIPLHPDLKLLLDDWIARRPADLRSNRLFLNRGRPVSAGRVDRALAGVAAAAGIGHVTPHQLRHTLATQAINRGMSLDAIAALLGHKTLAMTMVYARIADRTVADEYFAVTEKVEALYGQPAQLPASDEGHEMRRLRAEMHRRMLGNGYCARPVEMDCHFESICESCTFFVTTLEFRPTLQAQRDDAERKGQVGRQRIFEGLLQRLDTQAG
jgi:integrase/recombinase XerD